MWEMKTQAWVLVGYMSCGWWVWPSHEPRLWRISCIDTWLLNCKCLYKLRESVIKRDWLSKFITVLMILLFLFIIILLFICNYCLFVFSLNLKYFKIFDPCFHHFPFPLIFVLSVFSHVFSVLKQLSPVPLRRVAWFGSFFKMGFRSCWRFLVPFRFLK